MKGFEAQCLEAGFTDYLSKPINIDQFMERMARLLGGRKVKSDLGSIRVPGNSQDFQQEKQTNADSGPIVSNLPAHIEKFRKIIVRFVKRLDEQLDALEKAADGKNLAAVADLAHWLKGAGGTVGFDVFTEPAAKLELHAKNNEDGNIKPLILQLRQLARRIVVPQCDIAAASVSEVEPAKKLQFSEALPPNVSPAGSPPAVVSRLANMKRLQPTILKFVDTLDDKIAKMEAALDKKDMTELASLAHWLKGAGGTVGYDDFTKPAAALESCARAEHVEMAGRSLKDVKLLVDAIVPPVIGTQGVAGEEPV